MERNAVPETFGKGVRVFLLYAAHDEAVGEATQVDGLSGIDRIQPHRRRFSGDYGGKGGVIQLGAEVGEVHLDEDEGPPGPEAFVHVEGDADAGLIVVKQGGNLELPGQIQRGAGWVFVGLACAFEKGYDKRIESLQQTLRRCARDIERRRQFGGGGGHQNHNGLN